MRLVILRTHAVLCVYVSRVMTFELVGPLSWNMIDGSWGPLTISAFLFLLWCWAKRLVKQNTRGTVKYA